MTFMKLQKRGADSDREVWINVDHVISVTTSKASGNTLIRLMDGVTERDQRSPLEVAQALVSARGPFA